MYQLKLHLDSSGIGWKLSNNRHVTWFGHHVIAIQTTLGFEWYNLNYLKIELSCYVINTSLQVVTCHRYHNFFGHKRHDSLVHEFQYNRHMFIRSNML